MKKLEGHVKRQYALPKGHYQAMREEAAARSLSASDVAREAIREHVEKHGGKCVACGKRKRHKDSWLCGPCLTTASQSAGEE